MTVNLQFTTPGWLIADVRNFDDFQITLPDGYTLNFHSQDGGRILGVDFPEPMPQGQDPTMPQRQHYYTDRGLPKVLKVDPTENNDPYANQKLPGSGVYGSSKWRVMFGQTGVTTDPQVYTAPPQFMRRFMFTALTIMVVPGPGMAAQYPDTFYGSNAPGIGMNVYLPGTPGSPYYGYFLVSAPSADAMASIAANIAEGGNAALSVIQSTPPEVIQLLQNYPLELILAAQRGATAITFGLIPEDPQDLEALRFLTDAFGITSTVILPAISSPVPTVITPVITPTPTITTPTVGPTVPSTGSQAPAVGGTPPPTPQGFDIVALGGLALLLLLMASVLSSGRRRRA